MSHLLGKNVFEKQKPNVFVTRSSRHRLWYTFFVFGLHNLITNFLLLLLLTLFLFVCLFVCFFRSAEHCNQIIECFNVLISIEIGYSLFELMYDTVMIDTSAFIVTKV